MPQQRRRVRRKSIDHRRRQGLGARHTCSRVHGAKSGALPISIMQAWSGTRQHHGRGLRQIPHMQFFSSPGTKLMWIDVSWLAPTLLWGGWTCSSNAGKSSGRQHRKNVPLRMDRRTQEIMSTAYFCSVKYGLKISFVQNQTGSITTCLRSPV